MVPLYAAVVVCIFILFLGAEENDTRHQFGSQENPNVSHTALTKRDM